MARTPLLRALRRLAEEHRTAERLGIEPARLHEARMSRRELVRRGGIATAALALPGALAAAAKGATAPRIAIIGGGIAGLSAALALQDKGVYADVYESSSRPGGRMHSDWQEFGTGFWDNG
ncbi:MAG: FAD-dependent oxidoreductase, partial [Actinobacteria bacterium]